MFRLQKLCKFATLAKWEQQISWHYRPNFIVKGSTPARMRAFGQNDSSGPRGRQGRQPGPWCPGRCCRGAACSAAAARITPGLDHDPAPPDTHRQSSYSVILYFYTHFYTNNLIYYFLTPYFYTTFLLSFLYCIFIQIFCTKFSIWDSSFIQNAAFFMIVHIYST